MENIKINISEIKSAGKHLKNVAFSLIAMIAIVVIQFIVTSQMSHKHSALKNAENLSYLFLFLYLIILFIIIYNFAMAGSCLISCDVENLFEGKLLEGKFELRSGEEYEGGLIVYSTNGSGSHGLICSSFELDKANWEEANKCCLDCKVGDYSDWRLPTKDELSLIYEYLHKKRNLVGKNTDVYWSSSEFDVNFAFSKGFSQGINYSQGKSSLNSILAVRNF